ncbi:hypothetical protein FQN49_007286 [Arthroderma sp. PD_2]|nr:hypothetical protein FQN49_007286 [Arthroderma sp. PD_2]
MSEDIAAAIPVAYATALYGLRNAGNTQPGESVLIHSGVGAVGQAAIALAKYLGAGEIFVTVGSLEKRKFLQDEYSIPEENIFSSRDMGFGRAILKRTNGKGVDVVLNSLSGDTIRESCSVLAPFGRFIEIGKRDIQANGRLELQYFEKNITFSVVDLAFLVVERPNVVQELVRTCLNLVHQSKVRVLTPITTKPVAGVGEHFRAMQGGKHRGKLLLKMLPGRMMVVQPSRPKQARLRADCSYLIAGGTGSIGMAIIRFLATLGARNIVTVSRSGTDAKHVADFVKEMRAIEVQVTAVRGNVNSLDTMREIEDLTRGRPVRGIIQAATSSKDSTVSQMPHEQWIKDTEAKVAGTMKMHDMFGSSLDFFILVSSVAGIIGTQGAGGYCAGNTFQDAFARHHASLGAPMGVINLGMIPGEGVVADKDDGVVKNISKQGVMSNTIHELFALLNYTLQNPFKGKVSDRAQIVCGIQRFNPESGSSNTAHHRPDARFSHIWSNPAQEDSKDVDGPQMRVQQALRGVSSAKMAVQVTLSALQNKMCELLAIPRAEIHAERSVTSYGVDSLIAVELRNWIITQVGAHMQMMELMGQLPMVELSGMIAQRSRFVQPEVFEVEVNGTAK